MMWVADITPQEPMKGASVRVSKYVQDGLEPSAVLDEAAAAMAYAVSVRQAHRRKKLLTRRVDLDDAQHRLAAAGEKVKQLVLASNYHPDRIAHAEQLREAGDALSRERRKLRKMQSAR